MHKPRKFLIRLAMPLVVLALMAASCPGPTPVNLTVAKAGSGDGRVTSTPLGIDCGDACDHEFTRLAQVTLVAEPDEDSFFAGWSGACEGEAACTVTMDSAKSVTATFEALVLIPPTTKVLEGAVAAALVEYDGDGDLSFDAITPFLEQLEPGDVVVAGPTEAAPYGLLRKVTAVHVDTRVPGGVLVETEAASLQEAIHRGTLDVVVELAPEDVEVVATLHDGVQTSALDPFRITVNSDFGTDGAVTATGNIVLQPVLEANLGLEWDGWWPDLYFRFLLGLEESADLTIIGRQDFDQSWSVELVSYRFTPLTFSIGPVPIVLVPRLAVHLGADLKLAGTFTLTPAQDLTLTAGLRYHTDDGFERLGEQSWSMTASDPTIEGHVEAKAYAQVSFELWLYDLVGGYAALSAGPSFDADLSAGLTADPSLVWKLDACLWGNVGLRKIPVLDIGPYDWEVFRKCTEVRRQANRAPTVKLVRPLSTTDIYPGEATRLTAEVWDPDGHTLTCAWSSSDPGDNGLAALADCDGSFTFATLGARQLTVTATDPMGAAVSKSVGVTVIEPPEIRVGVYRIKEVLLRPVPVPLEDNSEILYRDTVELSASATGGTAPYAFEWRVRYPLYIINPPIGGGSGPGPEVVIGTTQTVTWTLTDTLPPEAEGKKIMIIVNVVDDEGVEGRAERIIQIPYIVQ